MAYFVLNKQPESQAYRGTGITALCAQRAHLFPRAETDELQVLQADSQPLIKGVA